MPLVNQTQIEFSSANGKTNVVAVLATDSTTGECVFESCLVKTTTPMGDSVLNLTDRQVRKDPILYRQILAQLDKQAKGAR